MTLVPPERRANFLTDANFQIVRRLEVLAQARARTVSEVALAWLAAQPTVTSVIAGATSVDQVRANVAGSTWVLTPDEVAEVSSIAAM